MSAVWFTADTHFGHEKILKYEAEYRPFENIIEHDAELVKRWNSVVRPKDLVWHLGDLYLGSDLEYFRGLMRLLNGNKVLIRGNHDTLPLESYLPHFTNVLGVWPKYGFVMSHIPLHPSSVERWGVNVHGHLHHNTIIREYGDCERQLIGIPDPRYYCVSVEQHNLTPVNLDTIRKDLNI